MTDISHIHSYPDRDKLVAELAAAVSAALQAGLAQDRRASIAVSGGSTPVALFEKLSEIDIPWNRVDVCLVDERWVNPEDADSNEQLVRRHLLTNRAAAATFTGMKTDAETAGAGELECAQRLEKIHRPFDVLILGMGGDGHTASLFPGAKKLSRATDMDSGKICMAIAPPNAPHERMTLTLPAIINSQQIFLHITGQDKKDVLQQALAEGGVEEMPIRFILQKTREQNIPFSIYWAQ